MTYKYEFRVEDVTCEKCDARIHEALANLPGVESIYYTRLQPSDEAQVGFVSTEELSPQLIEEAIAQKSIGTTHTYRVRWNTM